MLDSIFVLGLLSIRINRLYSLPDNKYFFSTHYLMNIYALYLIKYKCYKINEFNNYLLFLI